MTSAKLLEKAASSLPEPPTSDGILRNLWAMKDETLGGLIRVPFLEGKPAPINHCPICQSASSVLAVLAVEAGELPTDDVA